MDFSELKAEVLDITRRPDLDSQTESAIKAATLKAHQSDFFHRDLVEVAVEFDLPRYIQNFAPKEVLPNFRKPKYVRIWEGSVDPGATATHFLEFIHIENALDMYGYTKLDVFYQAGTLLQIRVKSPIEHVLFGAYVNPVVTPTNNYESWIADDYPWAIIYEAARSLFLTIGYQEQSAQMRALVQEQYGILSMSGVDTIPT